MVFIPFLVFFFQCFTRGVALLGKNQSVAGLMPAAGTAGVTPAARRSRTNLPLGGADQLEEILLRIAVVLLPRHRQALLGEAQRPRPLAQRQHPLHGTAAGALARRVASE